MTRERSHADILALVWEARPCFACDSRGACVHREIEADLASFQAAAIYRRSTAPAAEEPK